MTKMFVIYLNICLTLQYLTILTVFSCIIIDDDPLALKRLEEYISKIPNLNLIKTYSQSSLALKEIQASNKQIDFAFIEAEMPELNGLILAEQLAHKVNNIILVSEHLAYSLSGYDINAKHFLHKPFNLEKVEAIFKCLMNKLAKDKPYIMVRLCSKMHIQKVYADEIIAIKGNGNYINIYTIRGTLVSYYKLSDIEHDLKVFLFIKRINKSYIISTKHIEKIDGYSISLKNNLDVSVGESYRTNFRKNIVKLLHF